MRFRCAVTGLALISALGLSSSAMAGLTVDPNPVSFDNGAGVAGFITLVSVETGIPSGGVVIGGDTPGAFDTTLVFQVTMTEGFLATFGLGVVDGGGGVIDSTGAGWIPDDPVFVDITGMFGTTATKIFRFDADGDGEGNNNGRIDAGETSDLLFISFESLAFDGTNFVNFMLVNGGASLAFSVPLVPGPASLLVLSAGSLCLGRRRRRTA